MMLKIFILFFLLFDYHRDLFSIIKTRSLHFLSSFWLLIKKIQHTIYELLLELLLLSCRIVDILCYNFLTPTIYFSFFNFSKWSCQHQYFTFYYNKNSWLFVFLFNMCVFMLMKITVIIKICDINKWKDIFWIRYDRKWKKGHNTIP